MPDAVEPKTLLKRFGSDDTIVNSQEVQVHEDGWRVAIKKTGFFAGIFGATSEATTLFEMNAPESRFGKIFCRANIRTEGKLSNLNLLMFVGTMMSLPANMTSKKMGEWAPYESILNTMGSKLTGPLSLVIMAKGTGTVFVKDVELLTSPPPETTHPVA